MSYSLACTHLSDVTSELSENGRSAGLLECVVLIKKKKKKKKKPEIIHLNQWTPLSVTLNIANTECTSESVNQVIVVGIRNYLYAGTGESIFAVYKLICYKCSFTEIDLAI